MSQLQSTEELLLNLVSKELELCTRCNQCLEICPVTKYDFSIEELNNATRLDMPTPDKIRRFAFNCIQCGRCVPVCPVNLHRDKMMLQLRYKLRKVKPWRYKRYVLIRGIELGFFKKLVQRLFASLKKLSNRDLARYMETEPEKQSPPVLFYSGCYIYSPESIRVTLKLLDHVKESYEILGGLSTCCGVPHLLQGEFDIADKHFKSLYDRIKKINPQTVITGCAECYEALQMIKTRYNNNFEILTVVEYLLKHIDKFPKIPVREKVTLHDSCRITRKYSKGDSTRRAIKHFAKIVEMGNSKDTALCCYHWNHNFDRNNKINRMNRLNEAKEKASTMVCDCITCFEEFKEIHTDLEVLEVLNLFEKSIESETIGERN